MKRLSFIALTIISLVGCTIFFAQAQQPGNKGTGNTEDYWRSQPVYKALDTDRNGEISSDEIHNSINMLMTLDKDKNGNLNHAELGGEGPFVGWLRLQTSIRVIDRDGDSQISSEELKDAVEQLKRLDHNHDFKLSANEMIDSRIARMRGRGGPPNLGPAGIIGMMLNVILNNPEVTDPIMPGEDNQAYDGYIFFAESNIANDIQVANDVYLYNSKGELVHKWEGKYGAPEGTSAYLLENGLLLRQSAPDDWITMENFRVGSHGIVELIDWDGNVVWEYKRCVVNRHCLHHDLEPMPNGNILVLSYEAFSREDVEAMGGKIFGGGPRNRNVDVVWFEKILELKPNIDDGSTEILWEWNSWDHLVQEDDPTKANYGNVKEEVGKYHLNSKGIQDRLLHFNSIDYNPELDQILISSGVAGEIWIIDHSTTIDEAASSSGGKYGRGGDFLYRWGNPANFKAGSESDRVLNIQHDARWLLDLPGSGDITIHNNVAGTVPGTRGKTMFQIGARYSNIIELKLPIDEKGGYNRTPGKPYEAEVTWELIMDPPNSWYAPFMGGASRLPNGNTIVVNSYNKRIFEVTYDKKRVLDYNVPGLGRMFRVYKYPEDYPGFKGHDLTPGKVIGDPKKSLPLPPVKRVLQRDNQRSGQNMGKTSPLKILQNFDSDMDGKISREEFPGPPFRFEVFDKNKDGYIDANEAPSSR